MRRATPIRLQAIAVAVLFLAASASASHIRVAVDTVPVSAGTGPEFLRIAFADEPLLATVTIGVYTIPDRPSSALGFRALSELDPRVWWRSIEWTVTNTATKASYVIPGAAVEVVRATTDPIAVNGTSEHRGTFRLNGIAPGDYQLDVSAAGIQGTAWFGVRKGTETPAIQEKYLERQASRTTDYTEYKRIQFDRLRLAPGRADILLDLARRGFRSGTMKEVNEYYDRAIELMQRNAQEHAKSASARRATEVQRNLEAATRRIRTLQAELPRYFASRNELSVTEELVNGQLAYVIRKQRTREIVKTIQ